MLVCVLDDSGSNGQGAAFLLAGYIASVSAWGDFADQWQAVLDESPKLEYLKMREANSLRGPFWGWSPKSRDERIMGFVDVISETKMVGGITSTIFWDDWKQVSAEFPDVSMHPYDLLLHGTMACVVGYCRRRGFKRKIDFVFDEQQGWASRTVQAFETAVPMLMAEEREMLMGPPIHRDDKEFLPLQAADLIAWQTRRFCEDNKHRDPLGPVDQFVMNSAALQKLDRGTLCNTYGLDRLRDMARDVREARRVVRRDPSPETLRKWSQSPFLRGNHLTG